MGIQEYLQQLAQNLKDRVISCEQERWKAIGGQEVVAQIMKDVEAASDAQEKGAEVSKKGRKSAPKTAKS